MTKQVTNDNEDIEAYANRAGRVNTAGLNEAVDDWTDGEIDFDLVGNVIDVWNSGDRVVDYDVIELNDISDDTTLERNPDGDGPVVYQVTSSVDVDARLTIEPGVAIEFAEGVGLDVNSGPIVAVGTHDEPILFTATNPMRGWWDGIYVDSTHSENELSHCIVEYGGNGRTANLSAGTSRTGDEGSLRFHDSTLRQSGAFGLTLWIDHVNNTPSRIENARNNTYSHNALGAAQLRASNAHLLDGSAEIFGNDRPYVTVNGDKIREDATWDDLEVPYQLSGTTEIEGYEIEIQAGTTLQFEESAGFEVLGDSVIRCEGPVPPELPDSDDGEQPPKDCEEQDEDEETNGSGRVDRERPRRHCRDRDGDEETNGSGRVDRERPTRRNDDQDEDEEVQANQDEDEEVQDGDEEGQDNQDGDEADWITFTGTRKQRGWWDGIRISSDSSRNVLQGVIVEYAGDDQKANIRGTSTGRFEFRNCITRHSGGYGLSLSRASRIRETEQNVYENNADGPAIVYTRSAHGFNSHDVFFDNDDSYVYVRNTSVDIGDFTWDGLDVPYRMEGGNHEIQSGTMTIDPGAKLEFEQDGYLEFEDTEAVLDFVGTEDDPIIFTDVIGTPGSWRGILIRSENLLNTIEHAVIEYGGNATSSNTDDANVRVGTSGLNTQGYATIERCTVSHSSNHGLFIASDSNAVVGDNEFENNAGVDVQWD